MISFFKYSPGNSYRWKSVWQIAALVIACNYFAFRTELFTEEYEDNHPPCDPYSHLLSLSLPTLTWETFDKDNAPKAFCFQALTLIICISLFVCPRQIVPVSCYPQQLIRDKSPPVVLL